MAEKWTNERPEWFELDRQHPLHKGLVFAGLGGGRGSLRYLDASGYGNHGTLTNMTPASGWVWVPELQRWALDFRGTNSTKRVNVARNMLYSLTELSFACWSYAAGTTEVLYFGNDAYCRVTSTGAAFLLSGVSTSTRQDAASTHTASTWNHFAYRYGTGVQQIFVNGTVRATRSNSGNIQSTHTAAYFGSSSGLENWANNITGDMLLYARFLSTAEIQQLADPSNVMLSGLLLPPRRRLWPVMSDGGSVSGGWFPIGTRRGRVIAAA